jgi:serine/threonine protein phosphatase 1
MTASERTFAVGDIHGCLGMLSRLMIKIDWRPEQDNLIFLGDYVDRGVDPKGVVDAILELKRRSPSVQCLIGNHEELFLDFLNGGDLHTFLLNGGLTTLESYKVDYRSAKPQIPSEHLLFFQGLYPWIELQDHYFVHAGFRPRVDIQKQAIEDMLWIREPFISSEYDFGKPVIFGHTPFVEPLVRENRIGLDTGAVYGNKLTCLELPAMVFHSVEA